MPRRMPVALIVQCTRELGAELGRIPGSLDSIGAAHYFSRLGGLMSELSRHRPTSEEAFPAVKEFHAALAGIVNALRPDETRLIHFMYMGHGFALLFPTGGFKGFPAAYSRSRVKDILDYNSIHWSGVGELLGAPASRRIHVTPRFLHRLVLATPHFVESEMQHHIAVSIQGESRLTPGQLFVLLRSASNSLHSLKLNAVLHGFKEALSDRSKLRQSLDRLTSRRYWRSRLRKSNGWGDEKANRFISMNWSKLDGPKIDTSDLAITPSNRDSIWRRLSKEDPHTFDLPHFGVLADSAGLPETAAYLFHQYARDLSGSGALWDAAARTSPHTVLSIRLSKNTATVVDTGLGTQYRDQFSKSRFFGGTSGYLQARGAKIARKINGTKTRTVLRFKPVTFA